MSKGWKHSEETKEKIKKANYKKTFYKTKEFSEKMSIAAKKRTWTDQQKERLRQANLGKQYSKEINAKKASKGEKNPMWKGNEASYYAIHIWVNSHKGKPQKCADCGATSSERKLEWSNVDHQYKRDINDYVARCVPCHRQHDSYFIGFHRRLANLL